MEAREALPRVAVFLVVVLGLGVIPWLPAAPGAPSEAGFTGKSYGVFQPGRILATPPAAEGDVTLEARTREKLVLIDTEHANRFSDADVEPLVTALERRGHEVRYFDKDTAKPGGLSVAFEEADAFVVINPRDPFEVSEADAIEAFAQDGGRVLLVGRPTASERGPFGFRATGVENGYAGLASRFGISFGSGELYNMRANQNNYRSIYASPRVENPVTANVDRVVFRQATPVRIHRGTILLRAAPGTRLATTRERGQYPVMVRSRSGNVVAVGDGTFLFPENSAVADNEALLGNLAAFLVTGEHVTEDVVNETETETEKETDGSAGGTAEPTDTPGGTPDGDGPGEQSAARPAPTRPG